VENKMKKEIKIILIGLLAGILFASCKERGPVELIEDDVSFEERLDIEALSPEPNGYDSTGIVEPISTFTSLITVSGIQYTYQNTSIYSLYNAAMFFDRSRPIYSYNNRIVGYHLRTLGNVYFNGEEAGEKLYRMKYRALEGEKDTVLGTFQLLARLFSPEGLFAFPYDSYVNFELQSGLGPGSGIDINFDIPTPEKITGEVKIAGSRLRRDVRIDLYWNANPKRDALIEIIIGGSSPQKDGVVPIVRFRTLDDGYLRVPLSIMRSIPFDRHPSLVFTFRRSKYKNLQHEKLPDNHIVAQSIHNIKIDVP
jgi:hypothetical protein